MKELSVNETQIVSGGLLPMPLIGTFLLGTVGLEMVKAGALLYVSVGFVTGPYYFAAPVNYSAPIPEIMSTITTNVVNSPINALYGAATGALSCFFSVFH